MMEQHWYRPSLNWLTFLLLPFSWLFHLVVMCRRFCYQTKIKKSYDFSVPIIVVGNITVGGTGKTPFVIWLAQFLRERGFKPGIVSRGVGGNQQRKARRVEKHASAKEVGDEAILLSMRSLCPVVVGVDRVAAVQHLMQSSDCNIVISDDGLQHYRLQRTVEIAIVDGKRRLGNKHLLPAGPLRESAKRLQEVDFVVEKVSAIPRSALHDEGSSGMTTTPVASYKMHLHGDKLFSVKNRNKAILLKDFFGRTVHAVAAIGNPQGFFATLRAAGMEVIEHVFPDHHLYQKENLQFADQFPVVMTEKDAVKCGEFADEKSWYLPVDARVDAELGERLLKALDGS